MKAGAPPGSFIAAHENFRRHERDVLLNSLNADPEVLQEVVALLEKPEEPAPELEDDSKRQLGRIVPLKFLRPERIGVLSAEQLMREAKTLSGLNHPNIVTAHEVIQSPSGLAI